MQEAVAESVIQRFETCYDCLWKVLKRYLKEGLGLPNTLIWAYGSRVTGKAHPTSDLDIVAFAGQSKTAAISELREALEESNLPFRVDLFVWDQMPASFKDTIREHAIILQNDQ